MRGLQGRGRNYSAANTKHLLDLVEEIEPCGFDEWNEISMKYNAHFGGKAGENRSGEDLKNKFKALKAIKKPTGDPSCPPDVRRAKQLQKALEVRMDVQALDSGDEIDEDNNDGGNINEINPSDYGTEAQYDGDDGNEEFQFDDINLQGDYPEPSTDNQTTGPSSCSSVPPKSKASSGKNGAPGKPPLPKRKLDTKPPTTTLRTGLTEDQLRSMTVAARERSPSPHYSETVAKKRKIDSLLDKGSEILEGGNQSGGDNLINMIMLQNQQRDARAEEQRRDDREREDRRDERRQRDDRDREERRERDDRERDERRREDRQRDEEAKQEREDRREEREREREEKRDKAERERMEFLYKR